MDLDSLRIFVKVAELASFTRAAAQLGLTKARASAHVAALEASLGARLLVRTTRSVRPTEEGEQLLGRARRLLAEADEVATLFAAPRALRGRVRIDLPARLACDVVLPRLPELLAAHPQLELVVSTTDRLVGVAEEGFDVVVRVGALGDSGLVARRIGALTMMNCASPAYLRKHGVPRSLDDLASHWVVHWAIGRGASSPSFEADDGRGGVREVPMRAQVTVASSDAYQAVCLAGLGIIQAPRLGLLPLVQSGRLVEVLPEHPAPPMPVSLVHAHGRQVPARVRVVMQWLGEVVAPALV
jgi:DNA-binding transcriptional LysR family regulator